jgi:hypothetical protein
MASTPLAQLMTEIPSINDPKRPYSYAVDGQTIVGTWNIVNAKYLDLAAAKVGKIDKRYSIRVKFDEKKNRFDFVETRMINDPLFDFPKKNGWKPKSGLFNH